ncbi:hypothetical protein KUH03_37905 [Sphingobacterium sp. E70]|uniref:glycoside hydrolase family 16 protein n=1 Tax=Sphingobacterium sp. E70 TaxID=2853439 RepID=UPI00211BA79D|nr:hypothetical protein [Sphingobacterium sp. E70]ULT24646.1 hypothetical protein KUH03_37905 [Sphingobacterium sp. E70]
MNSDSAKTGDLTYHFSPSPTWSDEFNYSGLPDKNKWSYDVGSLDDGWGNNELQYYMDASLTNSKVEDGLLKITAKKKI